MSQDDQTRHGTPDEEPTQPLSGGRASSESGDAPEAAPETASDDEPTGAVPLGPPPAPAPSGWGPPGPQQHPASNGPPRPGPHTRPYPQQPGQPFGQHPGYRPYAGPADRRGSRGVPVWARATIGALALVLGVVGGLGGAALQDVLDERRGGVSNGLEGVQTQEAAPLEADNGSVPAVAQALLPSTVQILASYDGEDAGATGSGFVLDREGHVVTNNHVVAAAAQDDGPIVVIDHEGKRLDATVVGRSPVYDVAVLKVEGDFELQPAALGASRGLHVGDSVVAFGSPLGLSQTVTSGIVSALNRPVTTSGESDDQASYINAVQTDAAINPGNSGGPLVNLAGEVVGVNSAIATTGGAFGGESGNIGVGFAIPIEQVRTTVDQILRTGRARYPVIGAQVRTGGEDSAEGALITEVNASSPAQRAGLQKDDVVTAVDGQPVTDGISLIVAIRTHVPGDRIELTVLRGGDEQQVTLRLDGEVG